MDAKEFVKNLSLADKAKLTHGKGAWHTHAIKGLPSIMMTDGPHGLRKQSDVNNGINDSNKATCFPTASAVASSWNRNNAKLIAESIAQEAIAEDVSIVLGPGTNIKRSPLCGRNFEYFSEDPLLAGELASTYVSSMQAQGVGCSLKHFAVNSQESHRLTVNAVVDERALREIYLAAFEKTVRTSQPYTIMAAYNKINGDSCALNQYLLTDILRNEWGFEGLVMSDWGASYDMAKAYAAGLDLEMPDGGHYHEQKTLKALKSGALNTEHIDRACTKIIELVDKCNVAKDKQPIDYSKHHALCRQIEADSAVLLKNHGLLPLNEHDSLLVVGELAEKPRFQGAGSSHVNATCKSFLNVLDENGVKYTYCKGYSVTGDQINEEWQSEAAKLALKHNTVLFFGGLTDDFESEGYDRTTLDIPTCQQSLLDKLSQCNPNIAFVAFGGSAFTIPWIGQVKALLNVYLGGEAVTEAIYDLVFGRVSPSGRLAETFPLTLQDTPCYNYFANDSFVDEHRESVFVGYRYYNTFGVPVRFPFGYGLSYTHFEYSNLEVISTEDGFDVNVTVKNVGKCDACEVVQVYVDNCECGYIRPKRQLAAFDKVFVHSGASVDVPLHIDRRAFSIYVDGAFRVVQGTYSIAVCQDVERTLLTATVNVAGEDIRGNDHELYPTYYQRLVQHADGVSGWQIDEQQFYALAKQSKQEHVIPKRSQFTLLNTLEDMAPSVGLIRTVLKFVKKSFIKKSPTKSAEDPLAKMMYRGSMETPLISMMSVGSVNPKYVMFLLHHANRKYWAAFAALFGRYNIK